MIQLPKRTLNALFSIFFLSLSIFFRKMVLLIIPDRFFLILCFMFFINLTLSLNLILFRQNWLEEIKKISFPDLKLAFFAGIFLLLFYALATLGMDFTTSINYSFISRSTLIFSIILAYFFLGEMLNWGKISLMLTFFMGIYILATEGKGIVLQYGDILILLGTFFFSSFAILQKKLCSSLPPDIICWATALSGTIAAIAASLLLKINIFSQHYGGFYYIILAGAAEALAVLFVNKTIYTASVTYYTMMSMLTPLFNIFWGIIFLKEPLTTLQIAGGTILIISGVLVQRLRN